MRPLAKLVLALALLAPQAAFAQSGSPPNAQSGSPPKTRRSITDRRVEWPTWPQWRRVLFLEDHNTRVVLLATSILGLAGGVVGSFTLLRKRALMGDALSHATLPGIGLAFLLAPLVGLDGKSLPVLLAGAAISGLMGMGAILWIRNLTRIKEDAALGVTLSVFFGAGVAILGIVQQSRGASSAGLESFIYGKTASMVTSDAWWIAIIGSICLLALLLFFKELKLLCFDEGFAGARGFPIRWLDFVLMGLVTLVTIVGLQAVGLVLMIALMVIPAAAARFWTHRMRRMTAVAGALGAISCLLGAGLSATFPRLPSGAMIVLTSASLFFVSMVVGPARGIAVRVWRRQRLNRRVDYRHALRGVYELAESRGEESQSGATGPVTVADLSRIRSWSPSRLRRVLKRLTREGLVEPSFARGVTLTPLGEAEAARLTREHRLWELYLIRYADLAPGQVDRDADAIEHVLEPEMVQELEALLPADHGAAQVLASPHVIELGAAASEPSRATRRP